jgi:hypothetical protein
MPVEQYKPLEKIVIKDKMSASEFQEYQRTGKMPGADPVKKSKYGNVRKEVDGLKFDSTREANRFSQLMILHKAGLISKPILQYEFKLVGCSYVCDFLYLDYEKKDFVVEDSKGCRTDEYKIKAKQMLELYGITILET